MKRRIAHVLGIVLAVALVAWVLRGVSWLELEAALLAAAPRWPWLAAGVTILTADVALRAWRWQIMLQARGPKVPFATVLRAYVMSYALNNVAPGRLGEAFRPIYVARRSAVPVGEAAGTVVLERLLDLLAICLALAVFVFFGQSPEGGFQLNDTAERAMAWGGAGSALVVGLFFLAGLYPRRVERRLVRMIPPSGGRMRRRILGALVTFVRGLSALGSPVRAVGVALLTLAAWGGIALGMWVFLRAFDPVLPPMAGLLVMPLASFGMALPTPGGAGGVHAATAWVLTEAYHAGAAEAASAALVIHLALILPMVLWGGWHFLREPAARTAAHDGRTAGRPRLSGLE